MTQAERFITHTVENQAPPLAGFNAWRNDRALQDAVAREGGGWGASRLDAFGAITGGEMLELGYAANAHKPELKLFDRYGHRLDEVEFHPAYHRIMALAVEHGVPSLAWTESRPGAHVVRLALAYLHSQAEQGTGCPLTMTYACVPAIQHAPELAKVWLPKILSTHYDPRMRPMAEKSGLTIGMGMTEKQGGSDVRANTTRAFSLGGNAYELVGHKWFFSAPMCDAFLVLAYTDAGLTCFLLPRWKPDGTRNAIRIQRLKDKLGNWSNASSEVEFQGAWAERIGPEGRGVATILEMVALTRLDCMMGSAGILRQAIAHAIHHCAFRKAFGKRLIEQPLMRKVLADLALESEAAVALMMRVARAVDEGRNNESAAALARIGTALGKYWICKRVPPAVNEAQECLGGQGYVEESILPRLYREAPLNSIWEGSGNIQCLDVLRALSREPETAEAYFAELLAARGQNAALDREIGALQKELASVATLEERSRWVVERMALALQAALLLRAGNDEIAQSFCATRLEGQRGQMFGSVPGAFPVDALLARAWPES